MGQSRWGYQKHGICWPLAPVRTGSEILEQYAKMYYSVLSSWILQFASSSQNSASRAHALLSVAIDILHTSVEPWGFVQVKKFLEALGMHRHLLETADTWSLQDLVEISKGPQSELIRWLEKGSNKAKTIATSALLGKPRRWHRKVWWSENCSLRTDTYSRDFVPGAARIPLTD